MRKALDCAVRFSLLHQDVIRVYTTKQKGDITELACILALKRFGITVSIPYGENARYDLVADIGGKLYRIQCKTSSFKDGCLMFSCKSVHYNTKTRQCEGYVGEIDFFMTEYNSVCYLIPIEDCENASSKTLRIEAAKNNQSKNVSFASDYELSAVLSKMPV